MKLRLVESPHIKQSIFRHYAATDTFFPIIGSVIEGKQDGWILSASVNNLESFFVVHKFGFCQVIDLSFSECIDQPILELLTGHFVLPFLPVKLRLYAVSDHWNFAIQDKKFLIVEETERIRFTTVKKYPDVNQCEQLTPENVEEVSKILNLDLGTRFWNSFHDAAHLSLGVFTRDDQGVPACVCYAAAVSNGMAEIDVMTHPDQREKGHATKVVNCFVTFCKKNGILPVWDCFANNNGSLRTALRCNFNQSLSYRYLTIKPLTS